MKELKLKQLSPSDVYKLEAGSGEFAIEKKTGWLRSLVWSGKDLDLFQQVRGGIPGYIGAIRVYDEKDRVWYSDYETQFSVSNMRKKGKKISFDKRFRGAPFRLTVSFEGEKDCLRWRVAAEKANKKVEDRSLRVYFSMPLIAGWDFWAPCNHGEKAFDGMTAFEFMYTQIPYVSEQEIILPMISHYNRMLGVGYSMVEPIDANVPAAKFGFNNMDKCYNWGSMRKDARSAPVLEAVNYYIGLVGDRPMTTEVMIFPHEGGWRPGLGLVYRRWQEYFDPFNDAIYDREGVFMCGGIQVSDNVDAYKRMGLKTLEVHGHFQDYCDYFQAGKDRWLRINVKETLRRKLLEDKKKPDMKGWQEGTPEKCISAEVEKWLEEHTDEELAAKLNMPVAELYHTRDDIKRRLRVLAENGISCHWYFNYTDGYRPRVEKEWADSITRDEDGNAIPSGWYMCHNLNADPRWSFGKFAYDSARRIFEEYPTLDGFFLDCFRHYEIDFGHDDGTTVVNGKPCYSVNHSYDDIERLIKTEIMKPKNLTSFANKPMSIRSMRYCDGQLLEGNGDMYEEKFFWACIAMPMFFMWTRGDVSLDEDLRRSVLHGCYPRDDKPSEEIIALYRKYLPLYAQFRRRVFCFEPDPIRVPDGSRGKLYTVDDGYVAGIVNLNIDAGDEVKWAKRPYALFRVEKGHDVVAASVMYPGDSEMRRIPFKFDGTFIAVPMDGYTNCAVVKLTAGGVSGRKIGGDIFAQRARMCGDPDSAFEDISER
ncbi:MAG: hypothetical protein JW909_06750 [Planctomycetes bacterium]|nr:hypothetical protein [Planctomycetota bacterium]